MGEVDAFMSEQLLLMGFDQEQVTAALVATNNQSVDAALEALLSGSYLNAKPSRNNSSRPPNPINPTNPVPNPNPPWGANRLPDAKAIERARAEEREKERQRVEKERQERERRRAEKERARMERGDDEDDEDMYDDDYDDDDDDAALQEETLEDIVAAKSETSVVLDQSQIQQSATKEIERIATITDTSLSTAGALLRAFQWNSEKLLERYYENPEKVMKDAGVTASAPAMAKGPGLRTSATNAIKPKPSAPSDCEICGDDLDSDNSCTLECAHVFCRDCLSRYLEVQVNEGKSLDITCMTFKCKGRVPDSLIRKFTSPEIYSKYTAFVSKSFVEDNPNIKWCPRAGCGNAVKSDVKSISEAQCSCGFKFCFKCNGEAHAPGTCLMMKAWIKKCQDDSETSNWISANTKDCPKCRSAIEKNGGCNHMTCRKCKHEFCWICMGNWSGHSACNKFVEDSNKSMDRAALERYLHYFHRYQSHEASKKFEQTLREAAVVKMVSIQNTDSNRWIDVQYIDTATEQLIECRRTLKYTYVFAYYMITGAEKNLFEYLQAELEKTTEGLSGMLEAPVGAYTPRQIKDITGLAGKRLQHLREGVDEMMENPARQPIQAAVAEVSVLEESTKSTSIKEVLTAVVSKATPKSKKR